MTYRSHSLLVLALVATTTPTFAQPADDAAGYSPFSRFDADGDGTVTREEFDRESDVFDRLDRNDDGVLDAEDRPARRGRHRRHGHPGLGFGAHLIELADADQSGGVTQDEWQGFVSGLDLDGNGILDEAERQAVRPEGAPTHRRHPAGPSRLLDADRDGTLSTDELNDAWRRFDRNDDGIVDAEDRPGGRFARGRGPGSRPRRVGGHLVRSADAAGDANGEMTRDEWRAFLVNADQDQDGRLSAGEMLAAAHPRREPIGADVAPTVDELIERFDEMDTNEDGVVSRDDRHHGRRGARGLRQP